MPLREVQEAESPAAEARAALRSARAAIGAFGVDPPTEDEDGPASSSFALRSPRAGSGHRAHRGRRPDAGSGDAGVSYRRPVDAVADGARLRAGRGPHREAGGRQSRRSPRCPDRTSEGRSRWSAGTSSGSLARCRCGSTCGTPGNRAAPRHVGDRAALPVGGSGAPILTVPVAAVQRVRNEWCVFLPKDASTFEIRRIGRGRDLGGEVEVLSGLTRRRNDRRRRRVPAQGAGRKGRRRPRRSLKARHD